MGNPVVGKQPGKSGTGDGSSATKELPEVEVDMKTLSALERAKAKTRKEINRLSKVMKKVKTIDPLSNGVGAWGGPIAREVKSPGQHNGLKYTHQALTSPALQLTDEQMKEITKEHKPVLLPVWDHNFTVAGVISKDVERVDTAKDKVYKEEIKKFRTAEMGEELGHGVYQSVNMDTAIYLSDDNEVGQVLALRTSGDAELRRWNECQSKWVISVRDLHNTAVDITYKDLTDICCLREPPVFAEALIAYIGILLGLSPTWAAAKRSMFHDCFPLMVFLSQVEPLTIPIKRLRAATKLKKLKMRYLSTVSCSGVNASKAFRILVGWVLSFNRLAKLILEVHRRVKALNYKQLTMNDLPSASMLDDGSLGTASMEQIGEGAFSTSKHGHVHTHGPIMGLESSASLASPSVELGTSTAIEESVGIVLTISTANKEAARKTPRIGVRPTNVAFFEQLTNDMSLFDILTTPDELPDDDEGEQRIRDGGVIKAAPDADNDARDALASIEAIANRPFDGPGARLLSNPETKDSEPPAPTKTIADILKRSPTKKKTQRGKITSVTEDDEGYGDDDFEDAPEDNYGDDFEDDGEESHKAATMLQRMHRGRVARKKVHEKRNHHHGHGHGHGHGKHKNTMHFRKYRGSEVHHSDMSFGSTNEQHVLDGHKHKFHSDLNHGDDKEIHGKPSVHGGSADPSLKRTYGWKGKLTDEDLENTLMITYDVQHNMHYHDPAHPNFHHNMMGHPEEVQEKIELARAALKIQQRARIRVSKKVVVMKRQENVAAVKIQAIQRGRLGRERHRRLSVAVGAGVPIFEGDGAVAEAKIAEGIDEGKQSESKIAESKDGNVGKESESKTSESKGGSEGKEEGMSKKRTSFSEELAEVSASLTSDAVSAAVVNSPTFASERKRSRGTYSSLAMEEAISPSGKMNRDGGAADGGGLFIDTGTPTMRPLSSEERAESPSEKLVDSMVHEAMDNVTSRLGIAPEEKPLTEAPEIVPAPAAEVEADEYGDDFED